MSTSRRRWYTSRTSLGVSAASLSVTVAAIWMGWKVP